MNDALRDSRFQSAAALPFSFYLKDPDTIAGDLLGKILWRRLSDGTVLAGRICETEAYSQDDPASHSFAGPTQRTAAMFGPGGRAYVYLIYGIHHCFNVVTGPEGEGSAVLIRSVYPLSGTERMMALRGKKTQKGLCDGPGKIGRAFDLDLSWNGHDLGVPPLRILSDGMVIPLSALQITPRIGITRNAGQLRRYFWEIRKT